MTDPLIVYLHDHLAGAKLAIGLLEDLRDQQHNTVVAACAAVLLPDVERDRVTLDEFLKRLGGDSHAIKDAAAWISQQFSRLTLRLAEPLGMFEAVETLCLAVQGKLALWTALHAMQDADPRVRSLNLKQLIASAEQQHSALETLRRRLAATAFQSTIGNPIPIPATARVE
jgi:hypothetical protein